MPRGGHRAGSGRKPKSNQERELDGNAGHRPARVLPHPAMDVLEPGPGEIAECEAPDDLTMEERHVWLKLAPHAVRNRTLNKSTELAFRRLCGHIVLERELAMDGETKGRADHRGLIMRVDAGLLRFSLSPVGKPMYEVDAETTAAPVNPLDRYMNRKRA